MKLFAAVMWVKKNGEFVPVQTKWIFFKALEWGRAMSGAIRPDCMPAWYALLHRHFTEPVESGWLCLGELNLIKVLVLWECEYSQWPVLMLEWTGYSSDVFRLMCDIWLLCRFPNQDLEAARNSCRDQIKEVEKRISTAEVQEPFRSDVCLWRRCKIGQLHKQQDSTKILHITAILNSGLIQSFRKMSPSNV